MKVMIVLILSILFVVGCSNTKNESVKTSKKANVKTNKLAGTVLEKLDVAKYTYIKIKNSSNDEVWISGPKDATIKVGTKVSIASGMLMKDFVSKTLNKTFKEIYFVGSLTNSGTAKKGSFHGGSFHGESKKATNSNTESFHGNSSKSKKPVLGKEFDIKKIEKVEGGYSIEEIYQQKKELNGKIVKVKGIVVKFAPEIMKRNWVHIKDGSGKTENNDLTITTKENIKLGDTVTFEGKLAVDKDFGYGYKYSVIIEESSVK